MVASGRTSTVAGSSAGAMLQLIRAGQATTRSDLAMLTGLARSTVSHRIDALMASGLVREAGEGLSSGGRPPVVLAFNRDAGVVLSADLGATHGRLAVMDLAGRPLAETPFERSIADGPDAILGEVQARFDELSVDAGRKPQHVWAIGIGVPGPVEFAVGRPVAPPIMPGWDGVVIPEYFADRYPNVPVLVDNDVNIMALGEYWSDWRGEVDDLLFVKVGTGIGSGMVAGGRIHRGAQGTAGDIGHIRLADHQEVICQCGNRGCVEAVAGGGALARQLSELGLSAANSREVVELVRGGNTSAIRMVRDAGRLIGEVLAGVVNFFNPDVILIGGDVAAADEQLFAGVREVVYERSTALATRHLQIRTSRLEERAGIQGAAVLAIEEVLSPEAVDRQLKSETNEVEPAVTGD